MSSISGTDRQSVQSPGVGVGLQLPASLQQALDPKQVQRDLAQLLERAGLERTPDGAVTVKDTAALGKAGEVQGLTGREQIYGAGETQLKPPGPPRIELNKDLRAGAETFARNIDTAFNNVFHKGVAAPGATVPGSVTGPAAAQDNIRRIAELTADVLLAAFLKLNISDPNNSVETHNKLHEIMTELRQKGIDDARAKIETSQVQMKEAQEYAEKAQILSTVLQVVMIILTLILTAVTFGAGAVLFVAVAMVIGAMIGQATSGDALGGASIAGSIASFGLSAAVNAGVQVANATIKEIIQGIMKGIQEGIKNLVKSIAQMFGQKAGEVSQQIVKSVSQQAAKQAVDLAQKTAKDMFGKQLNQLTQQQLKVVTDQVTQQLQQQIPQMVQQQAQQVGQNLSQQVVQQITDGMSKMAPDIAKAAVNNASGMFSPEAFRWMLTAAQTGSSLTQAGANTKAGEMALQAQQTQVEAKRARTRAEMFQNQLQEESEIVKMIMESKNQVVDAVIKMMNAMFTSSQKLMSAGMAKG